jgi:hypothetical protein
MPPENINSNVSFIALKPHQKTNSRPNLRVAAAGPHTPRMVHIPPGKTVVSYLGHAHGSAIPVLSSIDKPGYPSIGREEQGNGYGIV